MKKLLLVLLVVAVASFLLVGCLPGTTPAEGEGEGEEEAEVIISVENEYKSPAGVTYVPCVDKVTVTFSAPVDINYVVYIARKVVDEEGNVEYKPPPIETEPVAATPNDDRTIWTVEEYNLCTGLSKQTAMCECEPICLVALVKHPCCPGEEVALRVVTVDCFYPVIDLFVRFIDCGDPCEEPDPCDPLVPGVYMEWTSRTTDICETTDCCVDECSGIKGWSIVVNPDSCLGPCDSVSGTACPLEGAIECGCFDYAPDTSEYVCYYVDFSIEDNVGNAHKITWKLYFDTDELVGFERGYRNEMGTYCAVSPVYGPFENGWYYAYYYCTPLPPLPF